MRRPTQAQLSQLKREQEAERAKWLAEERTRVICQRAIWAAIPEGEPKERLRKAMKDRAWALLDASQGEACDALLEFLPEEDQDEILRAFFPEHYE